ncbi:MAG: hypothetical protein GX894_08650 [Clostridia bacterium]|nr:hypothetical protein [Clostridia bacterium]
MDYLTRAKYDHGALRMMLDVQKEILARLAKARGVNLLHLEDILRFWEDFFYREHLPAEEEFLFAALHRLEHPALRELTAEHEELCFSIEKLVAIAGKLRAGKPNSGREFLETGNSFGLLLERHINKENSVFAELTVKEYGTAGFPRLLSPEDLSRLTRLFSLLNNLAGEYLGKEYDTTWLNLEKRKEPAVNREETAEAREKVEATETVETPETVEMTEPVETAEVTTGNKDEGHGHVTAEGTLEPNHEEVTEGSLEVSHGITTEGSLEANLEKTVEVMPETGSTGAAEEIPEANREEAT